MNYYKSVSNISVCSYNEDDDQLNSNVKNNFIFSAILL